ncbi:MAG: hypothetical protein FD143_3328 [Ignavibacteria bacterium]|nr:MAG: hypothetical protein FD143_3328 [Ignavibacteria bacterium]
MSFVHLDIYNQESSFRSAQYRYDNTLPSEREQTIEEELALLTFSKKFQLAESELESTDKDLRLAIMQDLFDSHSIKDLIDFCRKNNNVEKYLDEFLVDNKLI